METGVSEQIASALPPSSIDAERSVLGAVSYTHLDVYKRQVMVRSQFSRKL